MKKKDVALVLSCGGAKGFAHVGVIRVLERHGFHIHSVAGTSMGSLVGGLYATGELQMLVNFVKDMDIREMMKLVDINVGSKGLIKGDKVIAKMKELIPDRNIEDLKIPYCAIATDIVSGHEKVFTQGKLYDAIRASISIPTVFTPHKIDGRYYVDGAVINPLPVNRVKRQKRAIVVAVNVNAVIPVEKNDPPPKPESKVPEQLRALLDKIETLIPHHRGDQIGFFNLTNKSLNLMINQLSELQLELNPPDIRIDLPGEAFGMFDFYKAQEIIAFGERKAEKAIEAYLKK